MIITITEVSEVTQEKKNKNNWSECTVTFDGDRGPQKKTFRSFGPDWQFCKNLEVGKSYDVKSVKDGKFWKWVSVDEYNGTPQRASNASTEASNGGGGYWGDRLKIDQERLEFDVAKQAYIVRQSSITNAIGYYGLHGAKPTPEEVIETAKLFEEYVFSNASFKEMEIE